VHNGGPGAVWNVGGGTGCMNTVGGNLQFSGNASTGNIVSDNSVGGSLQCHNNGGITSNGNLVSGNIQGQCTGTGT